MRGRGRGREEDEGDKRGDTQCETDGQHSSSSTGDELPINEFVNCQKINLQQFQ